jgi:hypothetical protein
VRVFALSFILSSLGVASCGASVVKVPPESVASASVMPSGYEAVGNVVASCSAFSGFEAIDGEPLASFDCQRARLERVLAERASEASAEMLVGTRCGRDGSVLRCSAVAARPESPAARAKPAPDPDPGPVPGPAAIERWDEPRASTALVIRVDFEPSVARFERKKRRASDVAEVAALPVSHRELGLLTTRCGADECELRELRHALRIAAGGLGASDLVGVRCFGRGDERECVANVAATEIDE